MRVRVYPTPTGAATECGSTGALRDLFGTPTPKFGQQAPKPYFTIESWKPEEWKYFRRRLFYHARSLYLLKKWMRYLSPRKARITYGRTQTIPNEGPGAPGT